MPSDRKTNATLIRAGNRYKRPEYNLFFDYLFAECGLADNTMDAYRRDLKKFDEFLGNREDLTGVTVDDIEGFLEYLASTGYSSSTRNRALACVKSLFRFLAVEGVVAKNPGALIDGPRKPTKLPGALTPDKIAALLSAPDAKTTIGARDKAILELLYAAGLRASELVGLKVADIYLNDGFLRAFGKGSKERIVPVGAIAARAIEGYLETVRPKLARPGSPPRLFLSRTGRKLDRHALFRLVSKYARKAGIKGKVGVHTMRHSFATHLMAGGAGLRVVQELLGHASIATTQIYTHVDYSRIVASHKKYHPRA